MQVNFKYRQVCIVIYSYTDLFKTNNNMRYLVILLFIFSYLKVQSQGKSDSIVKQVLFNLEIAEVNIKYPISVGDMGFMPIYHGDVPGAVAALYSLPTGRIIATGNIPDVHIRFTGFRPYKYLRTDTLLTKRLECNLTQQPYEDKDVMAQIIFAALETKYNFTVSDTITLVDVWVPQRRYWEQGQSWRSHRTPRASRPRCSTGRGRDPARSTDRVASRGPACRVARTGPAYLGLR